MGFNATVVVMMDSLDQIKEDPEFGSNLAAAVMKVSAYGGSADVHSGSFCNAATVIECHHADYDVLVKVGGNYGEVVKTP